MPCHVNRARRATFLAAAVALTLTAVPAAADAKCKVYKARGKVESSVFQTDLYYFNISKRACYDGQRITAVSKKLRIEPDPTDGNVNVEYVRLAAPPIHRYVKWHGRRKGAHYSRASGLFKANAGPVSNDGNVVVSLTVYGNGKSKKSSQDADGPLHSD